MSDISRMLARQNLRRFAMVNDESMTRKRARNEEDELSNECAWMSKWEENNTKIDNVNKDMKENFKTLFERMDLENEWRRKELELFREENRLQEERLKQENLKRERKMDERLQNMQKQIDEMRMEVERMRNENAQGNDIGQEQSQNQGIDRDGREECMERVKGIEMWMDRKEREEKAKNLVISGWVKEGSINRREVLELLKERLGFVGTEECIEEVREIKTRNGRLIWMRMHDWNDKEWIMRNKSKLKGNSDERIFIDNDRTNKQRSMQRSISQIAQQLREKGNENVKVRFGRLENNGVLYRWDAWNEKLVIAKNERVQN